jgi:hypothetical protein
MIPITESWESIFSRIGERSPRHKRARCPIHGGDSPFSLSVDEDKGLFHCHVCHAGGDKIEFIKQVYKCSFARALAFFGLVPGEDPKPDPAIVRRNKIRNGLETWARSLRKKLNLAYYIDEMVITRCAYLLRKNPDDENAWYWLDRVLPGHAAREYELDLLSGSEAEKIEVFKHEGAA